MRDALLGLLLALALAACKREQVACGKFERKAGSRASLTQLDKSTQSFQWSECTDKKTRVLYCTSGHLHRTSCKCEVQEGERYSERKVKNDEDVPDDQPGATTFANQWCEFGIK